MKKLYIALLLGLIIQKSSGQTANSFIPKINNIPTSPEAALLGRFEDVPVGYYTGTPDISVPLYAIQESGITVPITLSYQSSGIKVTDEATWVGLGWNLTPEFTITQEVRGIKDAYDLNMYSSSDPGPYATFKARFGALEPTIDYKYLKQIGVHLHNPCHDPMSPEIEIEDAAPIINRLLQGDGQPDLYHYNLGSYSGSFYVNPETDEIVFLKKDANITIIKEGGFQAITPDGHTFSFSDDTAETAYGMDPNGNYAGTTYKISSIQFANGKTISFGYTNAHISSRVYNQNAVMNYVCINPPVPNQPVSWSTTNSDIKILTSIVTNEVTIAFNLGSRDDLNRYSSDTGRKLESIDIKSTVTNKKIKSFQFNYNYFTSSPLTGIAVNDKRLKLESVKEIGYDITALTADNLKPSYLFEYRTDVTMPPKNSYAYDFWGYNNGSTFNGGLLPDLDYFNYPYSGEFIDINHPAPFVYNYDKNNRYTDNTKAGALMLKKITYPTGGYTEFEFEPHSFSNQYIPDIAKLAFSSKVITRLANQVDTEVSQTFSITKACTLKFTNTFTHGFPTVAGGSPDTGTIGIIYNNAKIVVEKTLGGTTTIIKTWIPSDKMTLPDFITSGTIAWVEEMYVPFENGATYKLKAIFPAVNYVYPNLYVAKTNTQVNYINETGVDVSQSNQGGFRIKSIKNYTSTGIIASNKQLKYIKEDGTSSGVLLNKFRPLSVLEGFCNNCVGGTQPLSNAFRQIHLASDDFGTGGGTVIGYTRVEEIELAPDNIDNIGKKVFTYYNEENKAKRGFPNIVKPRNGLVQQEQVFSKSGVKLSEKTYTYTSTIPETIFEGIKIRNRSFGNYDAGDGIPYEMVVDQPYEDPDNYWMPMSDYDPYKFSYEAYPMKSYWFQPSTITTKEYFNGTEIASTQNITYTSSAQIRTTTTTFATGEQTSTTVYYPGEVSGAPASEAQMVAAKMTGIPLYTEQYKGSTLLSFQKTEYVNDGTTGAHMLPKYIYSKKASNTNPDRRITFDKYDDKGNLLQYTLEDGTPVCYVWGYDKTMPIAMIANATYASFNSTVNNIIVNAQNYSNFNNEASLITQLSALRTNLPNAMVTTYTFRPAVGVSTITDPKGDKITYTYDNFGRLTSVKDKDGNLLSENSYNYRP